MTKALVIGYGLIGAQHARVLTQLECDVAVMSSRAVNFPKRFSTLEEALSSHKPDYIVIANSTKDHINMMNKLAAAKFSGKVLIEKPLSIGSEVPPTLSATFSAVGYNLRFHPLLQELQRRVQEEKPVAMHVYCGAYLPDLKPGADYRKTYSAKREEGGGALRDFSHEIDYALWLAGPWKRLSAMGGKVSGLEISSDDIFCVSMETQRCPLVTINVNFLDRTNRREVTVHTEKSTIVADLLSGIIHDQENEGTFEGDRDETFRAMHHAMMVGPTADLCTLEQGLNVQRTIDAIESAAKSVKWISA